MAHIDFFELKTAADLFRKLEGDFAALKSSQDASSCGLAREGERVREIHRASKGVQITFLRHCPVAAPLRFLRVANRIDHGIPIYENR